MADDGLLRPRKNPCPTCPYRRDCPPGVWAATEYAKLPDYDGSTGEQAVAQATGVFCCHSTPDRICAGWAGCHDMDHNLAIRLHHREVDMRATRSYSTDVPLFGSGAEAAAHGISGEGEPSEAARDAVAKIIRLRERIGVPVEFRDPADDE